MKNYSNCCKSLRCALHASCFCWFHACIDKTCHWIWVFIFSGTVSWLQWQPHKKIHKIIGRFYVWCSLTGRGNPQPRLWRSWPTRLTTLWWTEKTGNSTWAPSPGNVNCVQRMIFCLRIHEKVAVDKFEFLKKWNRFITFLREGTGHPFQGWLWKPCW